MRMPEEIDMCAEEKSIIPNHRIKLEGLRQKIVQIKQQNSETKQALDNGFDRQAKAEHSNNILVYVLRMLGHVKEAEQEAESALQEHPKSILSHTNMAFLSWQRGDVARAEEQLQALRELRENSVEEFDDLFIGARLGIAFFYYLLGFDFWDNATGIYESIIAVRPQHHRTKLYLAHVIGRRNTDHAKWKHHSARPVHEILRAIDLLLEVKNTRKNSRGLRARAALELGTILSRHMNDDKLRTAVEEKAKKMGLSASMCFGKALEMGGGDIKVMYGAARYFRWTGQHGKAVQLLNKIAVLQPSQANIYYQIGLIQKVRAFKAKGWVKLQRTKASFLERTMKSPRTDVFVRDDPIVKEVMENFRKAVELSEGNYLVLHYDLGLMHKALAEFDAALDQFQHIIDHHGIWPRVFVCALEQCGLILMELANKERRGVWKEEFRQTGLHSLKMAAIYQARHVKQEREFRPHNVRVWGSFYALDKSLRDSLDTLMQDKDTPVDEAWLLRLLQEKDHPFPVLKDMSRYTQQEAEGPEFLEARVKDLQREKRFDDAVMFVTLLKLTSMEHVLSTWHDPDLHPKVHVQAAREMLLSKRERKDRYYMLRTTIAKMLFRWVFEDRRCAERANRPEQLGSDVQTADTASRQTEADANDSLQLPDSFHQSAPDDVPDFDKVDDMHVLIVHDPLDREDAATLQSTLRNSCGLKTSCLTGDASSEVADSSSNYMG
nr:hypothetical protein BaRGS_021872 [Batillaria attramentaria]